jgi:hypothetical protein
MSPEEQRARYQAALEQARHDYAMAWLVFGSVFVGQTVLLGFVGFALSSTQTPRAEYVVAAVVGILLWVPWFTSFERNTANHLFRVAQASSIEPDGWNILRDSGYRHSQGEPVLVAGVDKPFKIRGPGRLPTRWAIRFLQFVLLGAYLLIGAAAIFGWIGSASPAGGCNVRTAAQHESAVDGHRGWGFTIAPCSEPR